METHSSRSEATVPLGELASAFAQAWGVDPAQIAIAPRMDHEAVTARLIADARRQDATNRFAADIGGEYIATDWDHPSMVKNRAQIERIKAWKFGKRGILASGPTGLGKTRAITALYRRLACEEGRDIRYFNAADFFAALGSQVKYGRDDASGWVRSIAMRPIFILDDLGQEAVQKSQEEWAQSWFFRFLDIRREHGLPLIVSTNLSAQQITGRHDRRNLRADPLLQRLLDLCEVIKFEEPTKSENA